jgi:hypothetical protein
MTDRVEQARRVALELGRSLQDRAAAVILTGSAVASPAQFRHDSDVDLIACVAQLEDVLEGMPFFEPCHVRDVRHCLSDRTDVHGLASKGQFRDVLVSLNVIDAAAMKNVASLLETEIVYYRTTSNEKEVIMSDFTGRRISRQLRCEPCGSGFKSYEPTIAYIGGAPYMGILPDALLGPVDVAFDNGQFAQMNANLWGRTIVLAKSMVKPPGRCSQVKIAEMILKAKVKRETMSPAAIRAVKTGVGRFWMSTADNPQSK